MFRCFAMRPTRQAKRRSQGAVVKKIRHCPECASDRVVPIIHGIPTSAQQKAIDEGRALLADREEWEGMTQWYCMACGCDWSRAWRRFKKSE
jgi:hypothetical protein